MTFNERVAAQAIVSQLKAAMHECGGRIPRGMLMAASIQTGKSTKTLYRWITEGVPAGKRLRHTITPRIRAIVYSHNSFKAAYHDVSEQDLWGGDLSTFYRALKRDLSPAELAQIRKGTQPSEQVRLRLQRSEGTRAAERSVDCHQLPVQVVGPRGEAVKPWLVMIMDPCSRAIASMVLCIDKPNSGDVLAALGEAMRPGREFTPVHGIPERVRHDNGGEFTSHGVGEMALALSFVQLPVKAYSPHLNGKIERLFRTLDSELCATLPGYTEGALNPDGTAIVAPGAPTLLPEEMWTALVVWVHRYNFQRPHSGIGNRTPAEAWNADHTALREAPQELLWKYTLVPVSREGVRKVGKLGVRVNGAYYQSQKFDRYIGHTLDVRIRQRDERSCFVFKGENFICEAWPNRLGTEEQRTAFNQAQVAKQRVYEARSREGAEIERDRHNDATLYSHIAGNGDVIEATSLPAPDEQAQERLVTDLFATSLERGKRLDPNQKKKRNRKKGHKPMKKNNPTAGKKRQS